MTCTEALAKCVEYARDKARMAEVFANNRRGTKRGAELLEQANAWAEAADTIGYTLLLSRERAVRLRAALWAIRDVTAEVGSPSHEAASRALAEDDEILRLSPSFAPAAKGSQP